MDVASQFGEDSPAPFNLSEGGPFPFCLKLLQGIDDFSAALRAAHVRPQPEDIEQGFADGLIYGRDYVAGNPVYQMCEEQPSMFSKCWKVRVLQGLVRISCRRIISASRCCPS